MIFQKYTAKQKSCEVPDGDLNRAIAISKIGRSVRRIYTNQWIKQKQKKLPFQITKNVDHLHRISIFQMLPGFQQ